MEAELLAYLFKAAENEMTEEEINDAAEQLGINTDGLSRAALVAAIITAIRLGGFATYVFAVIVANTVARAVTGSGLTLVTNALLTRSIAVFAGPVGWALAGVLTLHAVAGPTYSITVPACFYIASLRSRKEKRYSGPETRSRYPLQLTNTTDCTTNPKNYNYTMKEELITPENASNELLKSVFDAAYLNATLDSDDLLSIKEDCTIFISLNNDKDKIQLATYYGFTPDSSEMSRLQLVNKINYEYIIVRAIAQSDDTLSFSWDISIEGGITKKNLILAVRRFGSIPLAAIRNCETDIVV